MTLLSIGLFTWCTVHLFPTLAAQVRADIIARFGPAPYRGCFALLIICSIVLMVYGWRSIEPELIYQPSAWGRVVTYVLVFFAFILFVAAKRKTNIKRYLRHPQLAGVFLWSVGHLLSNGDDRSLVLFITIALWGALEMILINRRAGAWVKPESVPFKNDAITVTIGVVLYTVLFRLHPYISGVKLF